MWLWSCSWRGRHASPGCDRPTDVASSEHGTVSAVPPVSAVARAWASTTPPRVKFTTGRPKPGLAKPCPATENAAGGVEIGRAPCRERVKHTVHGGASETESGLLPTDWQEA